MLGLLGVGAVFLVRFLTARSQVASAIVSWVGSSRVCLADADGDGTDDVIGYGVSGGTSYLYALHHETGAILWRLKPSDDSYDPLFCEEGAVLTYREADQAVHALDPTSGARSWKLALSDKLGSVAFGKDCAVVKSIDGAVTPIGLSDGRASDCKGTRSALQAHTRTEPSTARRGDFEAVAIGVGTGTARVRVSATRAGKALWSTDLDDVASAGASLVAVEGAVIVVGVDRKTRELVVTRLDAKTGKSEATGTANIEDKSDTFSGVATNDETVFVMTFGMLHAFDAESLELRWYAGNMWGKKK